jgi:hypothetical protein
MTRVGLMNTDFFFLRKKMDISTLKARRTMKYEEITEKIIQAFYKVYNTLG